MKDINTSKSNKSNYNFKAIKTGIFKRTRNPGLVKIVKLEQYIKHCSSLHRLCNSIAYSMLNPIEERSTDEWFLAINSLPTQKPNFWNYLAVIRLNTTIDSFEDILIVDYSILNTDNKEEFLDKYNQLREVLLLELKLKGMGK